MKMNREEYHDTNAVTGFLLFLSKTDLHALRVCTPQTRSIQIGIGMVVLITGIMAFISSFFAMDAIFIGKEAHGYEYVVAVIVSLFYATAIITFDREVVGVDSKKAGLARIPFAILIGVVISYPLELKLMENQIDYQVQHMVEKRNGPKQQEIDKITEIINQAKGSELTPIQDTINIKKQALADLTAQYNKECDRGECGPKAQAILGLKSVAEQALDMEKQNYDKQQALIEKHIAERYKNELETRERLQGEIAQDKESKDFLTQYLALDQIEHDNPSILMMVWFLKLFFIMFEVFPVLVKLAMPNNEYKTYLEARRRIGINKIVGITNRANAIVAGKIENAVSFEELKALEDELAAMEITDILEHVMEDSHNSIYMADHLSNSPAQRS